MLYFVVRTEFRNALLLLASLLFYAWGEGNYVLILIASIIVNYFFGKLIARNNDPDTAAMKKMYCTVAVIYNLSLLVVFKYASFIADTVTGGSGMLPKVHLPLGISFFTFKAISYIVDIYRGKVDGEQDLMQAGLYICLFPQLLAGPISRYADLSGQIQERELNVDRIAGGVRRFVVGLAKKVLIADVIAGMADQVFALKTQDLTFSLAWIGIIGFTLQIYVDFSGYTDMAIGIGRIFGFEFAENFNYPYISKSIREFWKRWHITLSTWFRDYLYLPLGGSRSGPARTYLNLTVVFFLCGLWHGASWCFVVWGLWNGLFLVLERLRIGKYIAMLPTPFRHAYAMTVVMVGLAFFRSESLSLAFGYISALFGFGRGSGTFYPSLYLDPAVILMLVLGVMLSMPLASSMKNFLERVLVVNRSESHRHTFATLLRLGHFLSIIVIYILSIMQLAGKMLNPFIYFKF